MEEFFQHYQYTVSALSVFLTLIAVSISLYLTYKARSKSIEAKCFLSKVYNKLMFFNLKIYNLGLISVSGDYLNIKIKLTFCNFTFKTIKTRFNSDEMHHQVLIKEQSLKNNSRSKGWLIEGINTGERTPMFIIEQGSSMNFSLKKEILEKEINKIQKNFFYSRILSYFCKIKIDIAVPSGDKFKVKSSKEVKKDIKKMLKERK